MRRALAVAFALWVAAPASADTVDVLKRNTLTLTDANGGVTTVLLSDEGKMEQRDAAGMRAVGFWSAGERGFCWTARGKAEVCIPLAADKEVGDSWEIGGPTGRMMWTARLVEGRADLKPDGQ